MFVIPRPVYNTVFHLILDDEEILMTFDIHKFKVVDIFIWTIHLYPV